MAASILTTVVSTKGQVILPKTIRDQRHWPVDTRLIVQNTSDGVLLKPAPIFPPASVDAVFGSLSYWGKARTIERWMQRSQRRPNGVLAIDTNVVIRFLPSEEKKQANAARDAIAAGNIFIATTALLESEWALRSAYEFTPAAIAAGPRAPAYRA